MAWPFQFPSQLRAGLARQEEEGDQESWQQRGALQASGPGAQGEHSAQGAQGEHSAQASPDVPSCVNRARRDTVGQEPLDDTWQGFQARNSASTLLGSLSKQ